MRENQSSPTRCVTYWAASGGWVVGPRDGVLFIHMIERVKLFKGGGRGSLLACFSVSVKSGVEGGFA